MKIPFVSYSAFEESWISTSRNSIDVIEGAHDTANITLSNARFKGTKKGFRHILLWNLQKYMNKNKSYRKINVIDIN